MISKLFLYFFFIFSLESFNHLESWLKEVKTQSNPEIKIFLIGNKSDLEDQRKIPSEKAQNFVNENGLHYFNETSAKTGFNAKTVFIEAAKCLYEEHLKYKDRSSRPGSISSQTNNIKLPRPVKKTKEEKEAEGEEKEDLKEKKKACC